MTMTTGTGPRTLTNMTTIRTITSFLAALLFAFAAQAEFPDKPIKIVVPYAAGGGADLVARVVGQQLSERLKQPVVVENQGGGSNTIGMGTVKRSEPDGYKLGVATPVVVTAPLGVK